MFYTYYHGCFGNIFFPKFLWQMKIFQIKPIFFIIIFRARIKKNYQKCSKKSFTHIIMVAMVTFFPKFWWKMKNFQIKPILFIIIFKARISKNIRNTTLHCYNWNRRFGTEKNNSTHLFHWKNLYQVRAITVFQLWILDLVCLWTMVLCLSLRTRAFVFSNFVITHICLYIVISINWNCVVIFVIVSFIIDLLNLHFHITRQRKMSLIIYYQPHNDFGEVRTES